MSLETPHGRGLKASFRAGDIATDDERVLELHTIWTPWPKQVPPLSGLPGLDVCITGVGGGKTQLASMATLRWALRHPRRSNGTACNILILGPDLNEVKNVQFAAFLERCRELTVPYGRIVQRVVLGQDPHIVLWNGVTIFGRSGTDPDRLRGYEFDFVWMDEAATQVQLAFELALNRMRSADCISGIITSSPRDCWLWRLISGEDKGFNELRAMVPVRIHRWSSKDNPHNKADVLAAIAAVSDASAPGRSRQELEGLFIGTSEAPGTGAIQYQRAFCGHLRLQREEASAAVLGVDLGQRDDYTWLTILSQRGIVLWMARFKNSDVDVKRDEFYPYVEAKIIGLVDQWKIPLIKVDEAMGGAAFAQGLKQRLNGRARVEGYYTASRRKKADCIEALGVGFVRGMVRVPSSWVGPDDVERVVPNVEDLRLELKNLVTTDREGFRSFDHPPGGHDDGVVSLALAFQGIQSAKPTHGNIGAWARPGSASGSAFQSSSGRVF